MIQRSGVSRRAFLRDSVGVAAAWKLQRAAWALGFAQGTPVCNTVAAEQEVGPYYVAEELLRRDVGGQCGGRNPGPKSEIWGTHSRFVRRIFG